MSLQNISESVYVGLCLKIGTPQQVAIRRDAWNIMSTVAHKAPRNIAFMLSGSMGEGFRLEGSDWDTMHWPNNHRVLWDFSQAMLYNRHRYFLILCDSSESPPGFTLLWLPLEEAQRYVLSSCVRINGALCISSAMFRDNTFNRVRRNSTVHGPCRREICHCGLEYDTAFCFESDFWPPSASSWIDRCHSWPTSHVVRDIIRSGCHFVAIGHKLGMHTDNEWRISFSQAEQKIVYAMNHTQFLTYGLLKLFLKEIINDKLCEDEKLLCSYHMKTAIFWAVQHNSIAHWCPQHLLSGFWVCFKLLLKWVYEGVCPNFFIPENNMFVNKVHGEAQKNLFTQLYGLYENGIAFLLQSPSIRFFIMNALCNPRLSVCTDEHTLISEVVLDKELFNEINEHYLVSMKDLHSCMKYLHIVEQLITSPLTQCEIIMLQRFTAATLQASAFKLHNMYTNTSGGNKHMYIADKGSSYMLKLAEQFCCISGLLYIAMYFYKVCRHREALFVIEMTKVNLAQPGLMYAKHVVDPERYTEAVGGRSWSYKMRHAVADHIQLLNNICYISELSTEQQSSSLKDRNSLLIPPYIVLHMLEFLCCRHVDPMRAQTALNDLQFLVHHDQGVLIHKTLRDISWEILGICQQVTGNHQAALYSYTQSLSQFPWNRIQNATRHRIQDLH